MQKLCIDNLFVLFFLQVKKMNRFCEFRFYDVEFLVSMVYIQFFIKKVAYKFFIEEFYRLWKFFFLNQFYDVFFGIFIGLVSWYMFKFLDQIFYWIFIGVFVQRVIIKFFLSSYDCQLFFCQFLKSMRYCVENLFIGCIIYKLD